MARLRRKEQVARLLALSERVEGLEAQLAFERLGKARLQDEVTELGRALDAAHADRRLLAVQVARLEARPVPPPTLPADELQARFAAHQAAIGQAAGEAAAAAAAAAAAQMSAREAGTAGRDASMEARRAQERADQLAGRLAELEKRLDEALAGVRSRVGELAEALANQLREVDGELAGVASTSADELADLRASQARLANELVRFEQALRADLGGMIERVARHHP